MRAVRGFCEYAVARILGIICREAGMRLGDAVVGHMAWWYAATRHLTVGCCFHTLGIGY